MNAMVVQFGFSLLPVLVAFLLFFLPPQFGCDLTKPLKNGSSTRQVKRGPTVVWYMYDSDSV